MFFKSKKESAPDRPSTSSLESPIGTPAPSPSTSQPAVDPLSTDASGPTPVARSKRRNVRRDPAAVFGEVVGLLMRNKRYRELSIADLEWLVVPALKSNQFALAYSKASEAKQARTVGVALWACVDEATDRQLMQSRDNPIRLKPEQWNSGKIVWLIDAVGPQDVIRGTLARLLKNEFAGREVRMASIDAEGVRSVRNLTAA